MMLALIKLTRPYYSLPLSCGLIVITSYITGGNLGILWIQLFYACMSLFLVISAGYVLNDYCDMAVDAINKPGRMLPGKRVKPKYAAAFGVILFVLGLAISFGCGFRFFCVLAFVAAGLVVYDFYSKKMGVFKNLFAAVLTVSLYPLSFALAEPVPTPRLKALFIFPVWLFLTTIGYEMLKDTLDVQGDSIRACNRSFCGSPKFLLAARVIVGGAALLSMLPFLLGYCKWIYFGSSVLTIVLAVLSMKFQPKKAIPLVYAGVVLITVGSLADLLVYGA